jgi:hypothetical protein
MSAFVETVQRLVPTLLASSRLDIPLHQRAKFEGWLKIELAAGLAKQGWRTRLEQPYTTADGRHCRADVAVWPDVESDKLLIMLKTVNTNFRFDGVEPAARPVTMNFDGLIDDIRKLSDLPPATTGYVLFPVFPMSGDEGERETKLRPHLNRVAATGVTLDANGYVERTGSRGGVAWFLVRVNQV